MKATSEAFLKKAMQSLEAAELLAAAGYMDFAASRAYYAMFYVAEALLLERGLEFASHKAVIGEFGKEFAKSGELDQTLHTAFIQAQRLRHAGDYDVGLEVDDRHAKQTLADARRFIDAAQGKLFPK